MKKAICIFLSVLILAGLFSGCKPKEQAPLRVCVDARISDDYNSDNDPRFISGWDPIEKVVEYFQERLEKAGGPTDVVYECIPSFGPERETMLDRLRVEIGSGGGPDVFIMTCDQKFSKGHKQEPLFLMPEKAMNLGVFLPLDSYIKKNTKYTEWAYMNSVVLEAGKNSEGQQIIPLAYTFPVCVYRQEEYTHVPDKSLTWNDMLNSEDINLRAAAVWTDVAGVYFEGCPFMNTRDGMPEFILGDIADFENEELLFTEEELKSCMEDIFDLGARFTAGEFADALPHYNELIGQNYNKEYGAFDVYTYAHYKEHSGIADNTNATMVPLYSNDGGVTAVITSYAAVNRNTLRPKDAYAVIDFLTSYDVQRSGGLYRYFLYQNTENVPMDNRLMNGYENCLYEWMTHNRYDMEVLNWEYYLKPINFEAYAAARDQITRARFRDVLDVEFHRLYWDYYMIKTFDYGDADEAVAEAYQNMQRMLRE